MEFRDRQTGIPFVVFYNKHRSGIENENHADGKFHRDFVFDTTPTTLFLVPTESHHRHGPSDDVEAVVEKNEARCNEVARPGIGMRSSC